ncbi:MULTISPECIES: molybdate ABC transporter substrate-binding protein [Ramlibacter]|uniref:ABC transporter substrate-binding protein n=1 Tax=Ramlibacter pinisoli TaxID=2682844 RepID=A0A6N8IWB1_9BURK|nr:MULTISPECIES: substrate-binding domain-containing protein [Ramlibacter]MBA2965312.1 substrate-binding domain-containing protein [Ramlibacter sp. CGMCC 1.13660]MVQ30276.1 ABC transporter substrate-binding protein [Ramlibacter pinisoli]
MATVQVLSGGAAHGLVRALQQPLAARGLAIEGSFGAVGTMRDQLLAGAACDLLILSDALITDLERQGLVQAGSARPLGRVRTGVAVQAGAVHPAVTTGPDLAAVFAGATALYVPHTVQSTAGQHVLKVLRALGLEQQLAGRLREFPNGATAMRELATGREPGAIGCTQMTEILDTPGVEWVGGLPRAFELATVYTAAVCTRAVDPQASAACIELLAAADTEPARRAAGFDPL